MAGVEELLHARLGAAFARVAGHPVDAAVRRSQHADFQSDAALPLARELRSSPRQIATDVVAAADLADLCSAIEVSGPGFINLELSPGALGRLAAEQAADPRLGVPTAAVPETVVVDYSGPNAAKEMHVGHLRSTIIGDAGVRILRHLGHTVIPQNHIGEWGTPFGMLIEHLLDIGEQAAAAQLAAGELTGFYQAARGAFDTDEAFASRARARVVALQGGDAETLRLWSSLVEPSKDYFLAVYATLGVLLGRADFAAESSYNDRLESVVTELDGLGLLQTSEGALCTFPAGYLGRDGEPLPLIVRKRDGGFGYAATDLATIRHRTQVLHADRLAYVVGAPQRLHLSMVFDTARAAGWLVPPATAQHVAFGSVLGTDGKMLRTRAGVSVKLVDLLDEAVQRAAEAVRAKNPGLDRETAADVARAVGIGAVKYADLSTDRVKDYVFDFDRMLSFEGNTGPYLQYAHARIWSIFRRAGGAHVQSAGDAHVQSAGGAHVQSAGGAHVQSAGGAPGVPADGPLLIAEPAERTLVIELQGFGTVVEQVGASFEPHRLAGHLHAVAAAFSGFYEHCPVLSAEPPVRESRLRLCALTAGVLARGLELLGIEAPREM